MMIIHDHILCSIRVIPGDDDWHATFIMFTIQISRSYIVTLSLGVMAGYVLSCIMADPKLVEPSTESRVPFIRTGKTAKPGGMRVHHGAVDQAMITSEVPSLVMDRMRASLASLGIDVQDESEYKVRCIRPKKRVDGDLVVEDEGAPISKTLLADTNTIYGDLTQDLGDEVRFYVELTRVESTDGMCSLDIRRLKGNLRSYQFLYSTVRGVFSQQR
ncbi:hypothetical protein PENSPDRAFT_746989 [Peniophora sp. CONT]|nr:hypothetical protein PENSPDRAFT_746989 [Peniophora sp. CONT]